MTNKRQLNSIRTFDAVARRMSFSLAAEELAISQAAVSQQIRLLEDDLGARLFVRHNRSISLTEAGRAYFDVVREILDRLDSVTNQLFPRFSARMLTVRCSPSVATLWLSPKLRRIGRPLPGTPARRASALLTSLDDPGLLEESATATVTAEDTPKPTPRATANAPTRPTYRPAPMAAPPSPLPGSPEKHPDVRLFKHLTRANG